MKVWLDRAEVELLLDEAQDTEQKIAFGLAARCGLRRSEIVEVTPPDVVETTAGHRVRVWEGKGDQFRETPIPPGLVETIDAYADVREAGPGDALVDRSTRTIKRWVKRAGERLAAKNDDEGWTHLRPHDLRGTWATLLAAENVDPLLVCDWGGWNDLETFLEHYRGNYSPAVQRQAVAKVSWLGGEHEQLSQTNSTSRSPASRFE